MRWLAVGLAAVLFMGAQPATVRAQEDPCGAGNLIWNCRFDSFTGSPPDQVPACGPGLAYMLESMPSYMDVFKKVLQGSGECAEVNWTFLGFSMPEWTLLCFVLLAIGALSAGFRSR